jgi:hypothetical protein
MQSKRGAAEEAKAEVHDKARQATAREALRGSAGFQAQVQALQPKGAQPEGLGSMVQSVLGWFGVETAGPQPEPAPTTSTPAGPTAQTPEKKATPLAPRLDPAVNPETESEHVKGAVYTEVKGQPFVQGASDKRTIEANDVSQGQLGDCYFIAALAALAHSSPETVQKKITDHKNGTYTVHFHEGGDVVVDGRFPTKGGQIQFAGEGDKTEAEGTELWVMLIEKAWAKLKGGYEDIRGKRIRMTSTDAMQAITGKSTRALRPAHMEEDELFTVLADAQTKGWPMTLGVKNQSDPEAIKASKAVGLVPNHAYAILKVDAEAKTLELYNPWGAEYSVPLIKFESLQKYVSGIDINKD